MFSRICSVLFYRGIPLLLSGFLLAGCVSSGSKVSSIKIPDSRQQADSLSQTLSDSSKAVFEPVENTKSPASGLSPASELMIRACDNYISINPNTSKTAEVFTIKASLLYNNRKFEQSRAVYEEIISRFPESPNALDATKMIAQAYYEEKNFDKAQEWYKKLSSVAVDGVDKQEALTRIAESIFRMAESFEEQSRFKDAATQYERVALEYPESKIADIALFNSGLSYEKQAEWSHAILVFQRLLQKYSNSELLPKSQFRIAKCYEKLLQWDLAAEAYLKVTANYPKSELASVSLYNAAFCFENGGKLKEAGAAFEKMAQVFPQSEDAADVLFRAGEIYGKIKDWASVARVNQMFSERFGNDENRVVQALCMTGIAFYMQNREKEAVIQLEKAISTFAKLKNPSTMNQFYAAKAMFTIGEIRHTEMNNISLSSARQLYKKQLGEKSDLLDKALECYTRVIKFNISEWTTRSIFQIGQVYEDFALGIFKQERPSFGSIEERIALELGIAQAIENYFIDKAVHYHEQNVKLGIKEKIEDKYVMQSRDKLTYLPYAAGENYLSLVEIARSTGEKGRLEGFALIARKLQMLQKIAPFQEKAIDLFLKCLELGSTYQEFSEYYKKASSSITGVSFVVGETYSDVVNIARDAPIPGNFDAYERFIYQTKLLKQIEGYEDQALTNYLKAVKIAEAYKLDDPSVRDSQNSIAKLLFNKARCMDLLCETAFKRPPFPAGISEAEKEEYKVRFEEIGLKFQEQAFEIYKTILNFTSQKYAAGDYVTHAYVRLFQNFPEEYGSKEDQLVQSSISSGSQWRCTSDSLKNWQGFDTSDSTWAKAQKAFFSEKPLVTGFPGNNAPLPMWLGSGNPEDSVNYKPFKEVFFRRSFTIAETPHSATLYLSSGGPVEVYFNGDLLARDTSLTLAAKALSWDLMGKIRKGKNVIAIRAISRDETSNGVFPLLLMSVGTKVSLPKPPGFNKPLAAEEVREDVYKFPSIKNFSPEQKEVKL